MEKDIKADITAKKYSCYWEMQGWITVYSETPKGEEEDERTTCGGDYGG